MALHNVILRQVSSDISKNGVFSDECTDVANNEQFVICIRWVDSTITDGEDVIGLYNVGTTDSNTLVATIEDVLLHMGVKLTQCYG